MATEGQLLDNYLTVEQAAEELHVHPYTLKRWKAKRYGPRPFRIGKRLYYRREELATWLASLGQPDQGKRGAR